MREKLERTLKFLQSQGFGPADVGVVLGTGLNNIIEKIEILAQASYNHIPFFPTATVEFHQGKFIYGNLAGKKVIVMQGRFHYYEGYSLQDVTYPVRIMKSLGIRALLISNAAGGINLAFKAGELMLIEDHINLQGDSPLAFKGVEKFGERFVDMSAPYHATYNEILEKLAHENNIPLHKGVYAAVVGPQLETRAEYRMLNILGADAVGMSTVPEVIVANHLSVPVVAVSVITDECNPDALEPVDINQIFAMAQKAEPHLINLFTGLIQQI